AVFACIAAAACAQTTCAHAADTVDVGEGDGRLNAVLYRPQGVGPFPVVLGLHGCGGMLNRSGKIVRRYAEWGERLSRAGIASLFLNSYTPRGLGSQCRVREGRVRSSRERVADAYLARRWLQAQPWVVKNRISVVGWSNGGIASLWAVRPRVLPHDGQP